MPPRCCIIPYDEGLDRTLGIVCIAEPDSSHTHIYVSTECFVDYSFEYVTIASWTVDTL